MGPGPTRISPTLVRRTLALKFAELEDDAYAGGSGNAQPWGITHGVTQNVTAAANATIVPDDLKKLIFAVPSWARRNGTFLAHSSAAQAIALLKDTTGQYLVQPSAAQGEPDRLFGYPYFIVDGLPAMTTSSTAVDPSVLFGDVNSGYMIADGSRSGCRCCARSTPSKANWACFCTMRVGGDVVRPLALAKYLL